MRREPPFIHTHPGELHPSYWYCLDCDQYRMDSYSIRVHCHATHDVDVPTNGIDYADGGQVYLMRHRRMEWEAEAAERFRPFVASLRGADDFALEVGDGLPDA